MRKRGSSFFFFTYVSSFFFLGLFLVLGSLSQVLAFSAETNPNTLHDGGKITVTAQVQVSPEQRFLFAKNSSIALATKKATVGKRTQLHINLKGYQNKPHAYQPFSIRIYNQKKQVLQTLSAKTNKDGTAELTFIPNPMSFRGSFIGIDTVNDNYSLTATTLHKTQPIAFETQNYKGVQTLQNSIQNITVFIPDNRVIFVFSTRGKTAMLTRGRYVFFTAKNTSSKISPYLFAARDGPGTVTT